MNKKIENPIDPRDFALERVIELAHDNGYGKLCKEIDDPKHKEPIRDLLRVQRDLRLMALAYEENLINNEYSAVTVNRLQGQVNTLQRLVDRQERHIKALEVKVESLSPLAP